MAIPVLVYGRSGTGKSTSLRNLEPELTGIINVLNKPMPFRNSLKAIFSYNYAEITMILQKCKRDIIVIDDAGYLITSQFMACHSPYIISWRTISGS